MRKIFNLKKIIKGITLTTMAAVIATTVVPQKILAFDTNTVVYEDCDLDGYDDATGVAVPWIGFDGTNGDVIPEGWDGVTIYSSYYDYINKTSSSSKTEVTYPWTPVEGGTTGDYIADNYDGVETGHVFESVTQERLLDILASEGTYYIVFGGPEHATSQTVLATINEKAKADGITKIYHFDPYIDGYQLDITDSETLFKASQGKTVYALWTSILSALPESEVINDYSSSDTLLFAFSNHGTTKKITASYSFKDTEVFDKDLAKDEIAKVFRGGTSDGAVVAGDIRTDYEFFKRVYNASATYFNSSGKASATRTGQAKTEIFTEADKEGFALHQVNFNELINLLNSPGEHIIFFGASWCHNTQAIIGQVARKAKANGKTVYVYDTTVGNQLTFSTDDVNVVTSYSSAFNSRNSVTISNGNNNISYLYGELVKYLGDYLTENNTNANNSITYYPNGDLNGTLTSTQPWENGENKNAIRLQMPFLLAYDKDAQTPVTKQWLHKNAANDGTYTEYMLDLAWVLKTPEAVASTATIDGLSYVHIAQEAVEALSNVLGDKPIETTTISEETTTTKEETTTKKAATPTTPTAAAQVKAPEKAKISKLSAKKKTSKKISLTIKKIKNVVGYEVQVSTTKKFKKKTILVKKTVKKQKVTINSKKVKNKKKLYVRVRAYRLRGKTKVYGKWSAVKKVKIK